MAAICIPIHSIGDHRIVDIEVTVDGRKLSYQYRVEMFPWQECGDSTSEKAECLRRIISGYEKGWQLVQIGTPTDAFIPVTFRQVKPA